MIINKEQYPFLLSTWLMNDSYNHIKDEKYISATQLLKPVKEIILSSRVKDTEIDLNSMVSYRLGTAVHDSIEKLWLSGNYKEALKNLGYKDSFINKIKVNPTEPEEGIPVYIEKRSFKKINGWTVGGQFDCVFNGTLNDYKTTSTLAYTSGSRQDDYIKQGSIYRWLNPEIITDDFININYIFFDWSKNQAQVSTDYPQNKCLEAKYTLMSKEATETFITNKLNLLDKYWNCEEKDIPRCSEEDLWLSPTVYKYYSNPFKTSGRSTKNFSDMVSAQKYMAEKQGKGTIITQIGTPRKCAYCNGFSICNQAKEYFK